MVRKFLTALAIMLGLFSMPAFAGGRPVPVLDLEHVAVPWPSGTPGTIEQVQGAIMAGLVTKGWTGKPVSPGVIRGTLLIRKHRAEVDIAFSTSEYSIKYADSDMLNYHADGHLIHRNYNNWILNLRRAIDTQFVTNTAK